MGSTPKRPNFLIIVADDLGFSDCGLFGKRLSLVWFWLIENTKVLLEERFELRILISLLEMERGLPDFILLLPARMCPTPSACTSLLADAIANAL